MNVLSPIHIRLSLELSCTYNVFTISRDTSSLWNKCSLSDCSQYSRWEKTFANVCSNAKIQTILQGSPQLFHARVVVVERSK